MLDTFITSRVRRKVVILFTKYPDFKTHVRGLAKLIKEDAGNLQRELARLEKVGFLRSEVKKNTKVYRVNRSFALYRELHSMVVKSQNIKRRQQQ